MPPIPVLRKWRQEDHEFKGTLGYMRPFLKQAPNNQSIKAILQSYATSFFRPCFNLSLDSYFTQQLSPRDSSDWAVIKGLHF